MADIYLTKIERKTIFTRALIYVLILFLVADMTVTGPFYVNFIPWLYLLSIITSIRGVDKVLTLIIGTFTAFVASLITNCGFTLTTLLITVNTLLQLGLGMLSAAIINEFVLEHRLVKYIRTKKKILLILLLVIFTLLSFGTLSAMHGDIFTYFKSKARFNEYISKTYEVEYEIKDVIYNRNFPGKYAYVVNIDGEEVHFKPVLATAFKDITQQERLETKNKLIKEDLKDKLEQIVLSKSTLTVDDFKIEYEYTKVSISPNSLVAYITPNKSSSSEMYIDISESILELINIEPHITEIVITINGTSLHIPYENFSLITPAYIEGGFNIEDIDE